MITEETINAGIRALYYIIFFWLGYYISKKVHKSKQKGKKQ